MLRLLCAVAALMGTVGFSPTRTHLCVFIPISGRSKKDAALSLAALESWAREELQQAAGAQVRFVSVASTVGTPLEPYTLHVPGDLEVDYKRLPVRILKIWHFLGQFDHCDWIMKADSDTYVNLRAVADRLSCFDGREEHFLGVVHAIVPPRHLREMWAALYFGHGGSGYVVSRGLLPKVANCAPACLEDMLEMTRGDAMEDVIFALCLQRQLQIEVQSYGFLRPAATSSDVVEHFAAQEFVVNFHQARDELLDEERRPGEPLKRFQHWDAQPPALHGCLLVAHPVENETDLLKVHALVERDALAQHLRLNDPWFYGREEKAPVELLQGLRAGRARCALSPMVLAKQAEVRLSAPGDRAPKAFWSPDQLSSFYTCLVEAAGPPRRCDWHPVFEQYFGLSFWPVARTPEDCAEACCRSGDACSLFQFHEEEGCWLGRREESQAIESEKRWYGGVKI
ncbi:unnamed protein product [Durusdinium trenchii]|uniref:N-acetylgalactosaminide beta-1,3-galactosyltransferase n=1 Tax=Durusdinium trenchii TaxID=1381693 RepID=A0ABP0N009_9DINO